MAQTHACDHDHDQPGLSGGALAAGLTAAESRCAAAGQRLTAPRRRVLELLLGAGQPVKAYDLIAAYGAGGEPAEQVGTEPRIGDVLGGHRTHAGTHVGAARRYSRTR